MEPCAVTADEPATPSREVELPRRAVPGHPRLWTMGVMASAAGWHAFRCGEPFYGQRPFSIASWALAFIPLTNYLFRVWRVGFHDQPAGRPWRWTVIPVLILLIIGASNTDVLMKLRFERSRAAFESAASALLNRTEGPAAENLVYVRDADDRAKFERYGRAVGSYQIAVVGLYAKSKVVYFQTDEFMPGGSGFLYDPDSEVLDVRYVKSKSLGGGWYAVGHALP